MFKEDSRCGKEQQQKNLTLQVTIKMKGIWTLRCKHICKVTFIYCAFLKIDEIWQKPRLQINR